MADPLTQISTRITPQTEPGRPDQVKNAAGGYVFKAGDDVRVRRFLVLGTTAGTYYASPRDITRDNADLIIATAKERGSWLVGEILAISTEGRAPRQDPGLFALAVVAAHGDDDARAAALSALPAVARTASTLFQFVKYVEQFRGWGKGLRQAVARWYLGNTTDWLAYQMVKYRQRHGWTHRDVLRSAHVLAAEQNLTTNDPARRALLAWGAGKIKAADLGEAAHLPPIVGAFERVWASDDPALWEAETWDHHLPWEALPDAARTRPEVWATLVRQGMPITALLRNLPTLTRLGVLDDAAVLATVTARLTDPEALRKGRVHPLNVLLAARTYASGRSLRGDSTWTPNRHVVDALDAAFYASLHTVEGSGKRMLVALDVSGSMGAPLMDLPQAGRWDHRVLPLTVREAAAAMTLAILNSEPYADVIGFTGSGSHSFRDAFDQRPEYVSELDITPRRRLDDVVSYVTGMPFGPTDVALPALWAIHHKRHYDGILILTDNETWSGNVHPWQAMNRYRQRLVPDARMVVMAMTATDVSVADPTDPLSLDIAGLDASAPNLIADFVAGRV
jgi:60 kDa SS-A/Ro ribonucleoprotein